MMAKLWPGISVAAIAILAFLWLREGCNKPPTLDTTQIKMAAAKAGYDSARWVDSPVIADLTRQRDSIANAYAVINQERINAEAGLVQRAGDIAGTLAAGDQARVVHDTVKIIQNCDSLEAEVKAGIPAVRAFAIITDSMVKVAASRAAVQDSIIEKQKRDIAVAHATINTQQQQYDIEHKDDASKTKQLNFYKPAAKISIGIIVAAILVHFVKF